MEVILREKPKAKILIEGFPGFGLVGTIVTEYLLEHLDFKQIGEISFDDLPATVAIHKGKLVHPMGIFYSKTFNVVVLHAILDIKGFEWRIVDAIFEIKKQLGIKEILSIEGVASNGGEDIFCFNNKKLQKIGAKLVDESVIMGVTAALLLKDSAIGCLFAETHSNIPDSRAAARIIGILDKYVNFNLDTKPLMMQAEIFESKVKDILQKTKKTVSEADKKQMSYLG